MQDRIFFGVRVIFCVGFWFFCQSAWATHDEPIVDEVFQSDLKLHDDTPEALADYDLGDGLKRRRYFCFTEQVLIQR